MHVLRYFGLETFGGLRSGRDLSFPLSDGHQTFDFGNGGDHGTGDSGHATIGRSTAAPRGRDKLDPRFAAILAQTGVAETHWDTLGTKKCCSTALFGSLASSEAGIHAVLKRILNLDPDNVDDDLFEQGRLTMVWEACKARTAVESRERIERSVAQLAPQITESDFENAGGPARPNWATSFRSTWYRPGLCSRSCSRRRSRVSTSSLSTW